MPNDSQTVQNATILVVDDEADIVDIVSEVLTGAGYQVLVARDGEAATEVFSQHSESIAAVILDLTMPRKTGLDVLKDIRRVRTDTPVLLSSGFSQDDVTGQLEGLGVAAFMRKPYRFRELLAKLTEVLGDNEPG